jgi:lysophospholipase L1-like esterase
MSRWTTPTATLAAALWLAACPTSVAQPPEPEARFNWRMEERLLGDVRGNVRSGAVSDPFAEEAIYSLGAVEPPDFRVELDACRSEPRGPGVSYRWTLGSETVTSGRCRRQVSFPREGLFPVTLVVVDAAGRHSPPLRREIPVQDWLIVSLGDSVASGEGNPDRDGEWRSRRCHRSGRAGPARAALALERSDPRTSVTFVHLACSGATIAKGLLGVYKGVDPVRGAAPLPTQLDPLLEVASGREVDAVLLSVGANDVGFSGIVRTCLALPACGRWQGFRSSFESKLAALPAAYRTLADQLLATSGIEPSRVLVSEYFNPTRDQAGRHCGARARGAAGTLLSTGEWEWAEQAVLRRLNGVIAAAAERHGWRYVGGIDGIDDQTDGFLRHGYCAERPGVVHFRESLRTQGDLFGAMHPNALGHDIYGRRLGTALRRSLYPDGRPRTPSTLLGGPPPVDDLQDLAASDRELARRFRPVLFFDHSEPWRPLEVDRFLEERAGSRAAHDLCVPDGPDGDGEADCGQLESARDLAEQAFASSEAYIDVDAGREGKHRFAAPDLACNGQLAGALLERLLDCDGGEATALYYQVTRSGKMAYIDYWYFLRFNKTDGFGKFDHQADWEGMVVAVDLANPTTFAWAAYAAHEGPPWRYDRRIMRCDGGVLGSCGSDALPSGRRPHAYLADGSHATYPVPCSRSHTELDGGRRILKLLACRQNEKRLPERGFDGGAPWAANRVAAALKPFPAAWVRWAGSWKRPRGVRSPAHQSRFKASWRHIPSKCREDWCAHVLAIASAYERACPGPPQPGMRLYVCQPGGEVSARRRVPLGTLNASTAAGQPIPLLDLDGLLTRASASSVATEFPGPPLREGQKITLSGHLDERSQVFVRGRQGDRIVLARFDGVQLRPGETAELHVEEGKRMRLAIGDRRRAPSQVVLVGF